VTGLAGGSGSAVGPDGALYVTETDAGRVTRVDPRTGTASTFASGLPVRIGPVGGAMDVAFLRGRAYVLVTMVGPDLGGTDVVGIYRVDGPHSFTVVADIGAFSLAHPPKPAFFVPTGVQYAMQPYFGGFLVTDGHHNRVLQVALNGNITEVATFDDIVPTGLETSGRTVYVAQAGPIPHLPERGKVVAFRPGKSAPHEVASGARLAVDVEFGPRHRLYVLSQGVWPLGNAEGTPASPDTGTLMLVHRDGTVSPVIGGLDRPTSMEFIKNTAFVVTLDGTVVKITNVDSSSRHAR
jgi:sugar lactone lactonase YvrE